MSDVRLHALLPAAGSSRRFGAGRPKQYMPLLGRPLLAHSIDACRDHPSVVAVHVALSAGDKAFDQLLAADYPDVTRVAGGDSRAESVRNGLRHILRLDPQAQWVLVHDAARPCLGREALDRLVNQAMRAPDGGILAVPVVDTLKLGADGRIGETVDRSDLWAAQTPQLFPLPELLAALDRLLDAGLAPTDEAGAMEQAGYSPRLVEGDRMNIKVTHADDLALAEFILSRRQRSESS